LKSFSSLGIFFEILAASQRKDSALCIKAAGKAAADLEKFVKIAFK
jgi:hypothetical protein